MMPGRAMFKISGELVDALVHGWPSGVKTDLPDDARVISVYSQHDREGRLEVCVVYESMKCPPVQAGEALPIITPVTTWVD